MKVSELEAQYSARPDPALIDHIVLLENCSWADFQRIADARGDGSRPRLKYLEGRVELMTKSRPHERLKTLLAQLLEYWRLMEGIELHGYGEYTIQNETARRAAEADECYVLGDPEKDPPDLAIEVIWTHGGLDKLDVYSRLGVRELWLWIDGVIQVWVLKRGKYQRRRKSELLPGFDLELAAKLMVEPNQIKAIRAFEAAYKRRKNH